MIYESTIFNYLISIFFFILCFNEMIKFSRTHLNSLNSYLLTICVLLHPLCLDALMGPNLFNGYVSFFFFLKYLNLKSSDDDQIYGINLSVIYLVFSVVFNLYNSFLIIYHLKKTSLKNLNFKNQALLINTFALIILFSFKLFDPAINVFSFFSNFLTTIFVPINITVFHFGLIDASLNMIILWGLFIFYYILSLEKNEYYYLFIFSLIPVFMVNIVNINVGSEYWSKIIFYYSSLLSTVFLLLFYLSFKFKKIFTYYSLVLICTSIFWTPFWIKKSTIVEQSFYSLPSNFQEVNTAKKTLAFQYAYDDRKELGLRLLQELVNDNFESKELTEDILFFKNQK